MTGVAWRFVATPRGAVAVLLALLLAVIAATFFRYGFTTDDVNGVVRAQNLLGFLASGGTDSSQVGVFDSFNFYGVMPDFLALLLQRVLPFLTFDSRHLVSALFGAGGIYYAWRLGDALGGRWTGPVAALLLTFNPMWLGYMFVNMKDIPFATCLLAASYHGLRLLTDAARPSWRCWVGVGLWSGLLSTTKLLGLPMMGGAILVLVAFVLAEQHRFEAGQLALRAAWGAVAAIVGVLICAALFWPQLFLFGPAQLWQVIETFGNFTVWPGSVLLNGHRYPADQIPRLYLVTYILISMPLAITALYLAAAPLAIWSRRIALLGPFAIPIGFLVIQAALHLRVYNSYRHFLFVVPFVAVAAAGGFTMLIENGRRFALQVAAAAFLGLFVLTSTCDMARWFPYQYSSYNLLVGGLAGAQGRYYVDVWRSAHREALDLLAAATPLGQTYQVYSCGSPINHIGRPRLRYTADPAQASFVIALPWGCSVRQFPGWRVVAEVKRGDVVFASVLAPH